MWLAGDKNRALGRGDRGETTTPSNIRQTTPLHAQSTVCDCLNAESLVFISKGCRIKLHFGDNILFGFDAQNAFIIALWGITKLILVHVYLILETIFSFKNICADTEIFEIGHYLKKDI